MTDLSHADEEPGVDYGSYIEWKDWSPFKPDGKQQRALSREFREIEVGSTTDVLELGFGAGAFAQWAHKKGARYVGLEVNDQLVELARQAGYVAYNGQDYSWSEPKFDLIVALDVLEHIPKTELSAYFEKFAIVSRPGAIWFFRFPNGLSPLGLFYQNADITHQTALSADILRQASAGIPVEFADVRNDRFSGVRDGLRVFEPIAWLRFKFRRALLATARVALGLPNVNLDSNTVVVMRYRG